MMRLSARLLVLLPLLVGMPSFAQVSTNRPAASLDTIRQLKELDKKIDQEKELGRSLDKLKAAVDRLTEDKYLACMQAFGSDSFCTCLSHELPATINFKAYVQVVTSTKEELGYDKMGRDDKDLVDHVLAVREQCVARAEELLTTNKPPEAKSSPAKPVK